MKLGIVKVCMEEESRKRKNRKEITIIPKVELQPLGHHQVKLDKPFLSVEGLQPTGFCGGTMAIYRNIHYNSEAGIEPMISNWDIASSSVSVLLVAEIVLPLNHRKIPVVLM